MLLVMKPWFTLIFTLSSCIKWTKNVKMWSFPSSKILVIFSGRIKAYCIKSVSLAIFFLDFPGLFIILYLTIFKFSILNDVMMLCCWFIRLSILFFFCFFFCFVAFYQVFWCFYFPTGKRPLGRPRRKWEENIRIDLEEIGINAGNWVDSAQDRGCIS